MIATANAVSCWSNWEGTLSLQIQQHPFSNAEQFRSGFPSGDWRDVSSSSRRVELLDFKSFSISLLDRCFWEWQTQMKKPSTRLSR
jgi:hypothetical protein